MKCIIINSPDQMDDYREGWESLRRRCGGSIFMSFDLSKIWLETFKIARPRIVLIEEHGEVVGIAPTVVVSQTVFGYSVRTMTLIGEVRKKLGFNTMCVMLEPGKMYVMDMMMSEIKKSKWDFLRIGYLENVEANMKFVQNVHSTWESREFPSSMVLCPISQEEDVASNYKKKARENLSYIMKRLERRNSFHIREVPRNEVEASVDIYAKQHIARWNGKGGSIFSDFDNSKFLGSVMSCALDKDFGYMHELFINGEIAAQDFGFIENDTAYGFRVGMNNDYSQYSPGIIVQYNTMEILQAKGVKMLNMGRGVEDYKFSLGGIKGRFLGVKAQRGPVSFASKISKYPPFRNMDSIFGLSKRFYNQNIN